MPDIDIDFADRERALSKFKHVKASRVEDNNLTKHNTGVYFHEVPLNAEKNLCAVEYDKAEDELGYFKVDFLNVSLYNDVRDEEHLNKLMERKPLWELLEYQEFSDQLFHVAGHSQILQIMKPTTVEQLAAVLAMIRPAKRHLIGKPWNDIMQSVWEKPSDGSYYFKKSHATAYALGVVVHMNLICEKISAQSAGS